MSAPRVTLSDRIAFHASLDPLRQCVRAIAATEGEALTTAQQTKLWRLDAEDACRKLFGCHWQELSRQAASCLIEYLEGQGR